MPYQVGQDGYIDYKRLEENAQLFRPKLIIAGASAYPREWDYEKLRIIADKHGAFLLSDMAHIGGLVAAGEALSPFKWCDVVTTTTHKTLRGPRSGIIFFKKKKIIGDSVIDIESQVNAAVFPGCQGGPHENVIAGVAVALREAATLEFKEYAIQVRKNAVALSEALKGMGYHIVTGGTDNHIVLWDLRPTGITGSKIEKACDIASVTVNKNAVYGDSNAIAPGGVRLGTPALTSRGFKEPDFLRVASFLDRIVKLSVRIQEKAGKKLQDFAKAVEIDPEVIEIRKEVEEFSNKFPIPGI